MNRIIKSSEADVSAFTLYERDTLEAIAGAVGAGGGTIDPAAILADAREKAEQKVKEAYAEGLRRGTEAGEAAFAQAVGRAAQALNSAAEAVKEAHAKFLDAAEPQVVKLAHAIAQRIVHREVRTEPEIILSTVRAALANLLEREHLIAHVSPQDLDALRTQKVNLLSEFDGIERIDIVADESIEPGGCVVESDTLYADASLEAQLQHILDALME